MRQYIILTLLCFMFSSVKAQTEISASVLGGYSEDGFAAAANFQIYPRDNYRDHWEIGFYKGFLDAKKDDYKTELDIYTFQAGYHFRIEKLSSPSNNLITRFGIGGVLGKEKFKNKDLPNGALVITEDGLVYGLYGVIEMDCYLSDRVSLVGRYTHFYHTNSDISKSKFMIGVGLKYLFK